jgi:hypothetical protein
MVRLTFFRKWKYDQLLQKMHTAKFLQGLQLKS